jgi:hypothetical protein
MSDVVKFYPKDAAKDADNVLEQAIGEFDEVLILGWRKDAEGTMDARATLGLKNGDMLWLIERFKFNLLSGDYEGELEVQNE